MPKKKAEKALFVGISGSWCGNCGTVMVKIKPSSKKVRCKNAGCGAKLKYAVDATMLSPVQGWTRVGRVCSLVVIGKTNDDEFTFTPS